MEHELIERYLYAVTKQLPAKSRQDIERELRGLIGDLLEERCGDIAPAARAPEKRADFQRRVHCGPRIFHCVRHPVPHRSTNFFWCF